MSVDCEGVSLETGHLAFARATANSTMCYLESRSVRVRIVLVPVWATVSLVSVQPGRGDTESRATRLDSR